ncbi:MAG: hypothetical protein P8L47_04315 [Candidatus Marinamargulisbacteria bacterium]|jgi:hypothetical protein|nr:hypothetical protein [Candidatus Marinamargulisbacteria bacterium]|tara:strand:+ start:2148 stop:2453 length:306 start_codon:yes stop_codon:yes gene_type:complete
MSSTAGYDKSELNYPVIMAIVIGIAVFFAAVFVIVPIAFQAGFDQKLIQLEKMMPTRQLDALRLQESEVLTRFEWKSKANKTVYIPIDVAMDAVIDDYHGY